MTPIRGLSGVAPPHPDRRAPRDVSYLQRWACMDNYMSGFYDMAVFIKPVTLYFYLQGLYGVREYGVLRRLYSGAHPLIDVNATTL